MWIAEGACEVFDLDQCAKDLVKRAVSTLIPAMEAVKRVQGYQAPTLAVLRVGERG